MTNKVLLVHHKEEGDIAKQLARPIIEAGYEIISYDNTPIGDSTIDHMSSAITQKYPVVVCATARTMGSKLPQTIVNACQVVPSIKIFVIQMEEDVATDKMAMGNEVGKFWQNSVLATQNLINALKKHYPITPSENILQQTKVRSAIEGLKSPIEWFANWSGELYAPPPPPDHWLLYSCFIDTGIKQKIKKLLKNGYVSGITGFLGMGGVGKTYTAMRISHELINEGWQVCWVSLLQHTVKDALDGIAENFGLRFVKNLSTEEKITALQEVFPLIHEKFPKLLVVLDNAEHFPSFNLLLSALPKQVVLVTSRTREQASVVNYEKIKPLKDELACAFCTEFLRNKMDTPNWQPTDEDKEDLTSLAKLYAGHPLSLRTVLSGFLNHFPARIRRGHRPFQKVLEKLNERGLQGFEIDEKKQLFSANEPSEALLRKNMNATFYWLYNDLNQPDNAEVDKCAYQLLPVCAAVGTASFTLEELQKGISILQTLSDNSRQWQRLIVRMDESTDLLEDALDRLEAISLLQINTDEKLTTYALHPTVREFAFTQEDKNAETRPSTEMIWRIIFGLFEEQGLSDNYLELLPRIKKDRKLAKLAAKKLIKAWRKEEPRSNWKELRKWGEEVLSLTLGIGLSDYSAQIQCLLGELLDRMGDSSGLPMIYEGVYHHMIKSPKNIGLFPEEFAHYNKEIAVELCQEIDYEEPIYVWASNYLLVSQWKQIGIKDIHNLGQYYRFVLEKGTNALLLIPNEFRNISDVQSAQIIDSIFFDNSQSNAFLRLSGLFYEWALYPTQDHEIIRKAVELIEESQQYITWQQHRKTVNFEPLVIDNVIPPHWVEFTIDYLGYTLLSSSLSKVEFTQEICYIRNYSLLHGIRFFVYEASVNRYLGLFSLQQCNWEDAHQYFHSALSALSESHDKETDKNNELILLKFCCMFLKQDNSIEISQIEAVETNAGNNHDWELRSLFTLTKAYYFWKKNNTQDCKQLVELAQNLYFAQKGQVPIFAKNLLDQLPLSDEQISKKTLVHCNNLDWKKLPKHVFCQADRKQMTLVNPGLQYNKAGTKRIGLYPFYIDDEPWIISELQEVTQFDDTQIEANSTNIITDVINSEAWEGFLNKIGKNLPTSEEHFAAQLQLIHSVARESYISVDDINLIKLEEIERILNHSEKELKYDWNKILYLENEKCRKKTNILDTSPAFPIGDEIESNDFYEEFLRFQWISDIPERIKQFNDNFLVNFLDSKVMTEEQANKLAILTAMSLSLSPAEKLRLFRNAPTLSLLQCDELIKVFEDEQKEFKKLLFSEGEIIEGLVDKAQQEFLSILFTSSICVLKTASKSEVDPWNIHLKYSVNNAQRCYRLIRLIFTLEDMDGLIPIESS